MSANRRSSDVIQLALSPAQLESASDDLAADALSGRRELLGRAGPATEQPSDLAAGQPELCDVGGGGVGRDCRPCCTSLGREVVGFPFAALPAPEAAAAVGVVGGGMGDASAPPRLVRVVREQELGRNATFSFGRDLARSVAIRGKLSVQRSISTVCLQLETCGYRLPRHSKKSFSPRLSYSWPPCSTSTLRQAQAWTSPGGRDPLSSTWGSGWRRSRDAEVLP